MSEQTVIILDEPEQPTEKRREIVLVGIRANSRDHEPVGQFTYNASYRMKMGPFGGRMSRWDPPKKNQSYKRLVSLGLEWDHSMNLLPGCPNNKATFNKSDLEKGKRVVDSLNHWAMVRINGWNPVRQIDLVLLGSPVCQCFGLPFEPLNDIPASPLGTIYILPHPSGSNRWWNEGDNREQAHRFVRSIMEP